MSDIVNGLPGFLYPPYLNAGADAPAAKDAPGILSAGANPSEKSLGKDAEQLSETLKKTMGVEECQTCKNRRYQDGSDDPGVSFKSPTKLSPAVAGSAVMAHEREHYTREAAKARQEGREVVSNNIRIFTDVCPECGKTYVSGGETRTATRKKQESAQFAKQDYDNRLKGSKPEAVDAKA